MRSALALKPASDVVRVRGGRGLGDALYLRPIAEHFIAAGHPVAVLSGYPDVFIGSGATVEPFSRNAGNVIAHYVSGKTREGTTQWQDVCRSARVRDVPLRFVWTLRSPSMVARLKRDAAGRPIVLVHGGREPMDRKDGFGMELLPAKAAFDAALEELRDCYTVQIGKAAQIYPLSCNVDLNGATSVADLLDLASICDGIVAQCSFAIPLAEALGKPLLAVWSARAARSPTPFIRQTTPQKVLSSPQDRFVMDSWPAAAIREEARDFRFV